MVGTGLFYLNSGMVTSVVYFRILGTLALCLCCAAPRNKSVL